MSALERFTIISNVVQIIDFDILYFSYISFLKGLIFCMYYYCLFNRESTDVRMLGLVEYG